MVLCSVFFIRVLRWCVPLRYWAIHTAQSSVVCVCVCFRLSNGVFFRLIGVDGFPLSWASLHSCGGGVLKSVSYCEGTRLVWGLLFLYIRACPDDIFK